VNLQEVFSYVLCYAAAFSIGFATCAAIVVYFDLKRRRRG
jgi:hypothetical protein